jgi:hypothetical protein
MIRMPTMSVGMYGTEKVGSRFMDRLEGRQYSTASRQSPVASRQAAVARCADVSGRLGSWPRRP